MVYYRKGQVEKGRDLYHQALHLAEKDPRPLRYAEALIHLALEEIRSGSDDAREAVDTAYKTAERESGASIRSPKEAQTETAGTPPTRRRQSGA